MNSRINHRERLALVQVYQPKTKRSYFFGTVYKACYIEEFLSDSDPYIGVNL